MAYASRPFKPEDAPKLSDLIREAILAVGPQAYDHGQVSVWAARSATADRLVDSVGRGAKIWVAVDGIGMPVAFTLLEADGHLDMLYCDPAHTRRGLADQLLAVAEQYAREASIERLFTEASEVARPAFARVGYTVTARRDFEIEHAGEAVPIYNYAMEKCLSQDG